MVNECKKYLNSKRHIYINKKNYVMRVTYSITLLLSLFFAFNLNAQDSKPFFNKKKVIALNHPVLNYSANMALLRGMRYEKLFGEKEENLKGRYRTYLPQISSMTNPMQLEDAVAYEMLAAKEMGIDGFKFPILINANRYYTDKFIEIISAYVITADKRDIDFEFTVMFAMRRNPKTISQQKAEDIIVDRLTTLLENTKNSKKWLRNTSGEIVIFSKDSDLVSDRAFEVNSVKDFFNTKDLLLDIKDVYDRVESRVGYELAFIYESSYPFNKIYNNLLLDYFAGITQSKYSTVYEKGVLALREVCNARNRPYFQNAFPDQVSTQMLMRENDKKIIENSKMSKSLKLSEVYVKAQNSKLTSNFRDDLANAVKYDAAVIDVSSWNYYDEGSHLSPEMHHGFGYSVMLNYYKALWLGESTKINKEAVITSYKAYHSKYMNTSNIELRYGLKYYPAGTQDSIEVVTILNEPATVYCNGKYLGEATAGINAFYGALVEGKVDVLVKRGRKVVSEYTTSKPILSNPKSSDYITYTFSNLDNEIGTYIQNMTLDFEMKHMYNRFLLSSEKQMLWRYAAKQKYLENVKIAQEYGHLPNKYLALRDKIEKEYQLQIKKLLDEFQFEVWLEMEESAKKNVGIVNMNAPTKSVLDGYNILEVE